MKVTPSDHPFKKTKWFWQHISFQNCPWGHLKSTYTPRWGSSSTLKSNENAQGEEEVEAKHTYTIKKFANSVGDFNPHITMIKQVYNLLISCMASSTHLLAGFESMTCK